MAVLCTDSNGEKERTTKMISHVFKLYFIESDNLFISLSWDHMQNIELPTWFVCLFLLVFLFFCLFASSFVCLYVCSFVKKTWWSFNFFFFVYFLKKIVNCSADGVWATDMSTGLCKHPYIIVLWYCLLCSQIKIESY